LADLSPDSPAKQQGAVIFSRMWQKIAMSFAVYPQLSHNGNAKLRRSIGKQLAFSPEITRYMTDFLGFFRIQVGQPAN
jgi:hypothetical protein